MEYTVARMENTSENLASTVVMWVCTGEMMVSIRHRESKSAMQGSMRLLLSNVASWVSTMGWLVNRMERWGCISDCWDCSLGSVVSSWGLSANSWVRTDCSLEKLGNSSGSWGSNSGWWASSSGWLGSMMDWWGSRKDWLVNS